MNVAALRETVARSARRLGYRRSHDLFQSDYLRSLGFTVKTVLDIGVHLGTAPLYEAFDGCLFVLVDPQRGIEAQLRHRPARYVFVNKGLAAAPGRLTLREQEAGKTTFLERTELTAAPTVAEYEVETTTLDALLDSIDFVPPIGIKIDTEGFEMEVLKGLTRHWDAVQFVICEASIRRRFVGSYQMSELVAFMLGHDFMFFNFLNEVEAKPRYYDVLFAPRNSALFD